MSNFNKLLESIDTRSMRSMMEALNEADDYSEFSCDYYKDENGFWGEPGEVYAADMLKLDMEDYWEENKGDDPVLDEYDNMDEWINDTLAHMTLCDNCDGVCDEDLSSDIRKGKLKHDDEIDAEYAKDGDTEVQFQDRGMNTMAYDSKTNRWLDKQPRTASHTWGRVWKDGKMVKSMEGPKYQVRQDMARFLDGNKEEECLKEEVENDFSKMTMQELYFYYKDNVSVEEYPTFIDWAMKVACPEGKCDDEPIEEGKFTDRVKKAASAAKETNKIYKDIKKDPEKKGMSRQEKRRQAINDYLSMKGYNEE